VHRPFRRGGEETQTQRTSRHAALLGKRYLLGGADTLQRSQSTRPESFYRPRRANLLAGSAIGLGLLAGLYQMATQWIRLLVGVRRLEPARGLFDLELAIVKGIVFGAICGAALGWAMGAVWEHRHRRRRATQPSV
jgi:hypothetical protein